MKIRSVAREIRNATLGLTTTQFVPPGHFYSPVSSELDRKVASSGWPIRGLDLQDANQDSYLAALPENWVVTDWRVYKPANDQFAEVDAAFYAAVLRIERPAQVIEVGSGWSTAVAVETRDRFLPDLRIMCIEPHPERLRQALGKDLSAVTLRQERVQDTPWEVFAQLRSGDVLFVDSTHVVKPGSDVNRLILDILPRLPVGMLVHFHDVFDGFELPAPWLEQGRDWSEAYLLRAFLTQNNSWEIVAFTARLWLRHEWLHTAFPKGTLAPDGIWLRRVR